MAAADVTFSETGLIDDHYGSGPVSRRLLRRAALIYAVVVVAGLLPTLLNAPAPWQAGGLGLIIPGGGFLAVGGWTYFLFPLALLLAAVACALWLLMANVFAPLFVWLASAGLAAGLAGETVRPSAPYLALGFVAVFLGWVINKHRLIAIRELERRAVRNEYLPGAEQQVIARAAARSQPGAREMSEADLAQLRYALDRGLQPVQELQGFDVIEQFQTSSIRYQIDYLLWALQVAQCHYTPNFHGYLSRAQRNLIDKLTVPKVWKWWKWESLFGNFSWNFDPIAKDNIMFGGFSSANVALYTANTGDDHYLAPGSLSFELNRSRIYKHSLRTMLDAGRKNHQSAVYGPLYPCEPKLTYSACNLWGNFAHLTGDRIFGTDVRRELVSQLKPLHIGEMMCRDGTVHAGRVTPLGIRIPVYTCNHVTALWGWMASAFFPDLSRRVWAMLREECVKFDVDGEISLSTESYDRMDTGNYRKSEAGIHAQFLVLAREQGDEQVARAILRKLDRDFDRTEINGTVSYGKSSNVNNATIVMGRLMRTGDVRTMVLDGPPAGAMRGPVLAEASYPDVLVAKAFSGGDDLSLVLYGTGTAATQSLGIERLQPNGIYRVDGPGAPQTIQADGRGQARFDVELSGRTEIRLAPQA
jgi:hypothetical protein